MAREGDTSDNTGWNGADTSAFDAWGGVTAVMRALPRVTRLSLSQPPHASRTTDRSTMYTARTSSILRAANTASVMENRPRYSSCHAGLGWVHVTSRTGAARMLCCVRNAGDDKSGV